MLGTKTFAKSRSRFKNERNSVNIALGILYSINDIVSYQVQLFTSPFSKLYALKPRV